MADNNSNQYMNDFMRRMTQDSSQNAENYVRILQHLSSMDRGIGNIDDTLQKILTSHDDFPSQGAARDERFANSNGPFGQHHANRGAFGGAGNRASNAKMYKAFVDALEESLIDSLGGSSFKRKLNQALENFASQLGTDIEGMSDELGNQFGKMLANNVKNSPIGQSFLNSFNNYTNNAFSRTGAVGNVLNNLRDNPEADISDFVAGLKEVDLGTFNNALLAGGDRIAGFLGKFIGKGNAWMILLDVGMNALSSAVSYITKNLQQVGQGFKEILSGLSAAGNRYYASLEKNQQYAQKRLMDDARTLIEEPFNILKKAAEEVYAAWDSNVRLIAGTQGYDKAGLQDLMSAYAQRLQSEGLSSVVASTDVYNNLAKVIQSGLSGNAAVEFAYQATKYGAAIPNHDFFNYVDTYASVASNAIAAGKSEAEALNIANQSLEDFSNSLLYASRNLTGGFSTGLKDADTLYSSAVKIAQAAKSENISGIASSLLAIQGYVGAIAPDLASSLSEKIYQLATGGNSDDLVALRSLAGINASNTEFLQYFSRNPQSVLSTMFANLGKMYTDSSAAYMEKAEGYASLFGLSSEAFQRVDFLSLSNAIINMSANSNSLDKNMELLQEGQTTTNADQMKIAQINQYMIEEGLAYVIDNEAARMIQEHMWDEQMQRELMEATYGVDLVGTAAEALRKIITGIENILNLLNPIAWLSKIGNISKSIDEAKDITADVKQVLELGVVGEGSSRDLYNLTTRNRNLQLTQSLVEMLGGKSRYGNSWYNNSSLVGVLGYLSSRAHPLSSSYTTLKDRLSGPVPERTLPANSNISSRYSWGSISKSSAAASAAMMSQVVGEVEERTVSNISGAISASVALIRDRINDMLSDQYLYEQYARAGKSYDEWRNSAQGLGITDLDSALRESGYDPVEVESYYQQKQTQAGMALNYENTERETTFYDTGIAFWGTRFWEEYNTPLTALMNTVIGQVDSMIALHTEWKDLQLEKLQEITDNQINWKDYFETAFTEYREQFDTAWFNWQEFFNTTWIEEAWKQNFVGEAGSFTKFYNEFMKKFVTHEYYDASGYKYRDVLTMQHREDAEKGDAIHALTDALTSNLVDLRDPQVQTNALLSQILVVATAIMNQNNNVAGTVSLSDALSSLALGLTTTTPMSETPVQNAATAT